MATASQLGREELEVLALVAERLLQGQRCYGLLKLATDQRNFHQESLEECCDGLVYSAAAIIRERIHEQNRRERAEQRDTGT